MKTAISLSDELFSDAERLAKRLGTSRSELYSRALTEYLARHTPAEVTESLDRALAEVSEVAEGSEGEEPQLSFRSVAGRRVLERSEW